MPVTPRSKRRTLALQVTFLNISDAVAVFWHDLANFWRARWSQPVVEKNYSLLIPDEDGPAYGFHVCSMAQIYPEDRGTNYAIRAGRSLGQRLSAEFTPAAEALKSA